MESEWYKYVAISFDRMYTCSSSSSIDNPHAECGDKITMPASALDHLASLEVDYPLMFEIQNITTNRVSHCGVLEFTAEEGSVFMPSWMMKNLSLQEGELVRVKNTTLQKGKYVKLQPHSTDFLGISNPKAMLETTLRKFTCLTAGDSIVVPYNGKNYYIDVIETKPCDAITVIETDCEVDFATPLDYKAPEKPDRPVSGDAPAKKRRAQGKLVFGSNCNRGSGEEKEAKEANKQEPTKKEEPKSKAFTGKSHSLR